MKPALTALAAGVLLPLSMAPFGLWFLGPLAPALWFLALRAEQGRGLLNGWLYGVGSYGLGVSWVYVSIHEHGGAPPLLAGTLIVIFASGMALFPMVQGYLFRRLAGGGSPGAEPGRAAPSALLQAVWFAILFITFEWLLGWVLTGFPWLAAGYGQLDAPLAAYAPLGGVSLVSFMVVVSGLALALFRLTLERGRLRRDWRGEAKPAWLSVAVLPWLLGLALGFISWTEPGPVRSAALVQGNIDQASKWDRDNRLPIIRHYRALSEPHWGVDLLLWPEAAITVFEHQAEELLAVLDARGRREGTGLVIGLPALEAYPGGDYAFLNTARGLGTASGRYVKRRLVPFGEYVPLEGVLRGLIEFFDLPMSHAEAGAWRQPPLTIGTASANMAICYEIVYPELVRDPVDVLLTISNDTWFGASIGPHQHMAIARMRALENGRWLLRATNNGITAIVDADGVIRDRLPQFKAGVLTGEYREMTGRTPFNLLGPWPLYLGLLGLAVWLGVRRFRSGSV